MCNESCFEDKYMCNEGCFEGKYMRSCILDADNRRIGVSGCNLAYNI